MKRVSSFYITMLLTFFIFTHGCATNDTQLIKSTVIIEKNNFIYQDQKITVGQIEGYPEAVGLLKSSLINALFTMYTDLSKNADYYITGSIFAKKAVRKRIYVYHTVSLRLVDSNGEIVMKINNSQPILQNQLDEFCNRIVQSMK